MPVPTAFAVATPVVCPKHKTFVAAVETEKFELTVITTVSFFEQEFVPVAVTI